MSGSVLDIGNIAEKKTEPKKTDECDEDSLISNLPTYQLCNLSQDS